MPLARTVAVVAALLISCAAPASAPSPSAVTNAPATTSAAPSKTATAVPSTAAPSPTSDPSRYGVLLQAPGRIFVRRERPLSDVVLAIGGEQPAASHDGKRVAFWRTGPQGNNPQELRIVDVIGGAERMLAALPAGDLGGAIVWANDDTGLLYEAHSSQLLPGAGGGPRSSRLESFDLAVSQAPGATDSQLVLTGGSVFVPLAWDKGGALASALITGEGGQVGQYVTWDRKTQPGGQSAVKRTPFGWPANAFSVRPSHDAKLMLAIDLAANALRVWPTGDITGSALIRPATGVPTDARWRSGTPRDVAWVVGPNVEVFTYGTSSVGTVYGGKGQPMIQGWRADGSAIYLFESVRGTFVVEIANLSQTNIWPDDLAVVGGTIVR
jgi:hypothetical protein